MPKEPDAVGDALVGVLADALARTRDEGLLKVLLRLVPVGDARMQAMARVLGDVAPMAADASRAMAHLADAVEEATRVRDAATVQLRTLQDAYGLVARLEELLKRGWRG